MERWLSWWAGAALALVSMLAAAQGMPADAPGIKDHPALTRYAGSWLYAGEERDFDEVVLPSGENKTARIEGRLTRLFYLSPAGKTIADVHRNYETALERAGAARIDGCTGCKRRPLKSLDGDEKSKKRSTGEIDGWSTTTMLQYDIDGRDEPRYWYGTLGSAGGLLHVAVLSGEPGIMALKGKYVATLVVIVQPKALETGKVQVDANALAKGLQAEGKIALYGIFFDTGKAEVKPESKAQLDEMAKLLQGDAALKVFVVGHTDNQGALESNLALSRARAQAVIDALVKGYKVDARRLAAAGVANYAPLAPNGADAGRARNRRVELVLQ